jgi:Icc-related predicted phosphoesterase
MDKNKNNERLRCALIGDIHNEFLRPHTAVPDLHVGYQKIDVLILAGDIDTEGHGAHWAVRQSRLLNVPVVYIEGNHEHYASGDGSVTAKIKEITKGTDVHFLSNEAVVIKGCRFIGSTLWTDFNLFGDDKQEEVMKQVEWGMNDFNEIKTETDDGFRTITPLDVLGWFRKSVRYITKELEEEFSGKTIVVTHHAPSAQCLDEGYEYDLISAGYASSLDELIKQHNPTAWFYGHIHEARHNRIGNTLVMNWPGGYPGLTRNSAAVHSQGLKPKIVVL